MSIETSLKFDLNSKIKLHERDHMVPELMQTELFIEAGSLGDCYRLIEKFENDWKKISIKRSQKRQINFEVLNPAQIYSIGHLEDLASHPTVVQFQFVKLNGHIITFYWPTGSLVYWNIIELWLKKHFPNVPRTDDNNYFGAFSQFCPQI